jgi:recombination protein RecA
MAEKNKKAVKEAEVSDDKAKALEAALKNIEKSFGKGAVMRLGDEGAKLDIDVISTSSIGLDMALGIGGVPRGRVVEIYGPESSGKTTLTLHIVAEAQKNGGNAAFVDAEHALDPVYAKALGVDIDNLLVAQPDTGEQALEIVEALVRSNALDVVVVDSVAALVPKAEIDGEMGDSHMGLQARLMSQALRKLTGIIKKSNTTVIFINQLREKIGVRKIESLKKGPDIIGNRTRAKIVKNKIAPPFKTAEFDIMYGKGISREGDLLDVGVGLDIVDKSGSWFSYKEARLGQGRDNSKEFLVANPDVAGEIEAEIRKFYADAKEPVVEEEESIEENEIDEPTEDDYFESEEF